MTNRFLVKALEHRPQRIKCSLVDHFVSSIAVSMVFFYRTQIPSAVIVAALQDVLKDFPIFSGALKRQNRQLYIDCNNQGVQVNIVHIENELPQILPDCHALNTSEFVDVVHPYHPFKRYKPVLTIKLSYHVDGLAIGYSYHHALGDAATFMIFLNALSARVQQREYPLGTIADDRELEFEIPRDKKGSSVQEQNPLRRLIVLRFMDIFRLIKNVCLPKRHLYLYFSQEQVMALRQRLSEKAEQKLSRNDAISAYVLKALAYCRKDKAACHYATMVLNMRPRVGMPFNVLGNFIDTVFVKFPHDHPVEAIAKDIHESVNHHQDESFSYQRSQDFFRENGGLKRLWRIIPEAFLPQYKNALVSNCSNAGFYSIDFGIKAPYLFLPVWRFPFPWMSCVMEGFANEGLLVYTVLPSGVAKRLVKLLALDKVAVYDVM
ncbi:MAG: acyltransferase [Gammaproteobacteria bacterium]|nr:acyltransferase [Gammaproteobacteria bacterium]